MCVDNLRVPRWFEIGVRPDAHNSRRIDIPKDDVDPYNRLAEGKKYFDLARPEYQDLTPIFKLVKEVLPQK